MLGLQTQLLNQSLLCPALVLVFHHMESFHLQKIKNTKVTVSKVANQSSDTTYPTNNIVIVMQV